MSNSLEESPLSDIKMDISETTSQESPCFSPDTDRITNNLNINTLIITNKNQLNNDGDDDCGDETTIIKLLDNHKNNINGAVVVSNLMVDVDDEDVDEDKINDSSALIISNNKNTIQSTSSLRSTLTLVNKHPLMSPPPSLKNSNSTITIDHHIVPHYEAFNYPDVVPQIEKLPTNDRLDIVTNIKTSGGTLRKITLLQENLLSDSESEPDLSQYQATVEPTLQSVSLITINNTNCCNNLNNKITYNTNAKLRRKVPISPHLLINNDDHSSIDSLSNHSLDGDADLDDDDDEDDDLEPNLASVSPTSSLMDDITFNEDLATPTNVNILNQVEPLPQYTADEERRDSRNWQKITLPDGKTREIDMKVIDPYKRVLSHGGYLKAGGHNAIVVFSACHLPDRSRTDYHYVMDNLFLYVVKTLEHLVTEDYVLVYLHGGSNRSTVPPFPWLKKCYQLIDRRLRKSLKNLFLVHPTFWLKSIVWMSRPFVSSKFWRKMIYVGTLEDLYKLVPVEKAAVPDKVKNYDSKFT